MPSLSWRTLTLVGLRIPKVGGSSQHLVSVELALSVVDCLSVRSWEAHAHTIPYSGINSTSAFSSALSIAPKFAVVVNHEAQRETSMLLLKLKLLLRLRVAN
ncbi:hypothetical protein GCM10010924_55410 [Rhizobium wenxiniae]|uniref:Uncharacterized protein n=1 Tax=Rhizobium wenxiniae TaxID=1737357 RepID=A0A7X0D2R9_9HYPH|nr:hypothetical protein [Rhizobium wenxiniae]GGG19115.1 hypothetical protein GCM10010924_55410 [Rhizobium wenxiniae]